jgi:dTDP-4-amino-4,6-dideoxygalactose transaminase
MKSLKEAGIGTAIHYPFPLHLQKAYASVNYGGGNFPVTESVSAEIVSLPMFPHLLSAQQERVAAEVLAFAAKIHETTEAETGTLVPAEPRV